LKHFPQLSFALALLSISPGPLTSAQSVAVFDTVYTPSGYTDGSGVATMFVPAVSNGIGIVLVHGCTGIRTDSRSWCDTLASYGYVAMSIEYPDPCVTPGAVYPQKTRAVKLAVEFLRRNAARFGITTGKIVGWGMSQGANTWGEAITWDNNDVYFQTDSSVDDHINAAVLLYGYYKYFPADSNWLRYYFGNDSSRIQKGTPITHIDNITTPVLLLHGTLDGTVSYEASVDLYDSLVAHGKQTQLLLFPGLGHDFDLSFIGSPPSFTHAGLIAKDTVLAFLRRTVSPALKIRVSSSSMDFGNVSTSLGHPLSIRIDNIGSSNLRLDSITHRRAVYSLLGLPSFPAAIPSQTSLEFNVVFHPTTGGLARDTIVLASNDTLHPTVEIALVGNGISTIVRAQAGVTYATAGVQPNGEFYTMNTSTGDLTAVGQPGVLDVRGLTIRPSNQEMYGVSTSSTSTTLYRLSTDFGTAVYAGTVPLGDLRAIAFDRRDTLYGATASGKLYRIDISNGNAVFLGATPGLGYSALSFSPSGKLWAGVRTPLDSIFTLNTTTGAATFVGTTGFTALTSSLVFGALGVLYALIDNGSGEDYLATLDTANASGTLVNSGNPLGVHNLLSIATRADSLVTSVDEQPRTGTLQRYVLYPNYPNPFNPQTAIRFQIAQTGFVSLKVYDLLGRGCATLENRELPAGVYTRTWEAGGVASGVYYFRLQAGNFAQTRKLILLK
jgi:dienelactone hydrolase